MPIQEKEQLLKDILNELNQQSFLDEKKQEIKRFNSAQNRQQDNFNQNSELRKQNKTLQEKIKSQNRMIEKMKKQINDFQNYNPNAHKHIKLLHLVSEQNLLIKNMRRYINKLQQKQKVSDYQQFQNDLQTQTQLLRTKSESEPLDKYFVNKQYVKSDDSSIQNHHQSLKSEKIQQVQDRQYSLSDIDEQDSYQRQQFIFEALQQFGESNKIHSLNQKQHSKVSKESKNVDKKSNDDLISILKRNLHQRNIDFQLLLKENQNLKLLNSSDQYNNLQKQLQQKEIENQMVLNQNREFKKWLQTLTREEDTNQKTSALQQQLQNLRNDVEKQKSQEIYLNEIISKMESQIYQKDVDMQNSNQSVGAKIELLEQELQKIPDYQSVIEDLENIIQDQQKEIQRISQKKNKDKDEWRKLYSELVHEVLQAKEELIQQLQQS